jgi:hypothetical protein
MPDCHFCSESGVTESHHIVPQRYDGSDRDENLVDVCPTCHEKLERLYDDRFYQQLRSNISTSQLASEELIHRLHQYIRQNGPVSVEHIFTVTDEYGDDVALTLSVLFAKGEIYLDSGVLRSTSAEPAGRGTVKPSKTAQEVLYDQIDAQGDKADVEQLIDELPSKYPSRFKGPDHVNHLIENGKEKGELYTPEKGYLRTT